MDPSCGFCTSSDCRGNEGYTNPRCPEHGDKGQGLAHACQDPTEVAIVTCAEVTKNLSGTDKEILKAVVYELRGAGNPKAILAYIKEFREKLK